MLEKVYSLVLSTRTLVTFSRLSQN
jgi:hypothetical protein